MNDQPSSWIRAEPGVPTLHGINWGGLKTLYIKEVRRFLKVHMQTIWAPAVNALLLLTIFTVARGGAGHKVMGAPFADFIAPGLIVSAMLQNSFANSSFALMVGKMQGTIVDYLMPPLSVGELIAGIVGAAVTRAFLVGGAVWLVLLLWPQVSVAISHPLAVLWFGLMGATFLGLLGLLTSIWADKFDQAAVVTNFVVLPLSVAVGHGLFGRAAEPRIPCDQSRQPVLLRDLRISLRIPGSKRFADLDRGGRAGAGQSGLVGGCLSPAQERVEDQELAPGEARQALRRVANPTEWSH